MEQFSQQLHEWIRLTNGTMRSFGERFGVSESHVSRLIRGLNQPRARLKYAVEHDLKRLYREEQQKGLPPNAAAAEPPPQKPPEPTVPVAIDLGTHALVERMAAQQGCSPAEVIRALAVEAMAPTFAKQPGEVRDAAGGYGLGEAAGLPPGIMHAVAEEVSRQLAALGHAAAKSPQDNPPQPEGRRPKPDAAGGSGQKTQA